MVSLEVPLYRQTMDFSCGPASLLMAFKYHDSSIPLDQTEEVAIWRDTNMVAIWGSARYGIAHASLLRGFETEMISDAKGLGFAERTKIRRPDIDIGVMDFFFEHAKASARRLGLRELSRTPALADARVALGAGKVPIALISTKLFDEDDIPHWVVVSGIAKKNVKLNNPLGKGTESYPIPDFERHFGFFGERTLVIVGPRGGTKGRPDAPGLRLEPPATRYLKQVKL
jgi:ABC-type bacteriocin/lantibiotic exporter with double-glycine peptidase domain